MYTHRRYNKEINWYTKVIQNNIKVKLHLYSVVKVFIAGCYCQTYYKKMFQLLCNPFYIFQTCIQMTVQRYIQVKHLIPMSCMFHGISVKHFSLHELFNVVKCDSKV